MKLDKDKIAQLHQEAQKRCSDRVTNSDVMIEESIEGFSLGLWYASEPSRYDAKLHETITKRVKTETNFGFAFICGAMAVLEANKGKAYRASWQKRGEDGIFANVERKFDRMTTVVKESLFVEGEESLSETVADNGVYSIKWMTFICETNPIEILNWIKRIKKKETSNQSNEPIL